MKGKVPWNKGKHYTISATLKGKPRPWQKGKHLSVEHRAAISAALKGHHPCSSETREKISIGLKGRIVSPETRAKMSAAIRAAMTPEIRAKMSARAIARWRRLKT